MLVNNNNNNDFIASSAEAAPYLTPPKEENLINNILPPEILTEIFSYLKSTANESKATNVSEVCKLWRGVHFNMKKIEGISYFEKVTAFFIENLSNEINPMQLEKLNGFSNTLRDTNNRLELLNLVRSITEFELPEILKDLPNKPLKVLENKIAEVVRNNNRSDSSFKLYQFVHFIIGETYRKKGAIAQASENPNEADKELENAFWSASARLDLSECFRVTSQINNDKTKQSLFICISKNILKTKNIESNIAFLSNRENIFLNEKDYAIFQKAFSCTLAELNDVQKGIAFAQNIANDELKSEALSIIGQLSIIKNEIETAQSLIQYISAPELKDDLRGQVGLALSIGTFEQGVDLLNEIAVEQIKKNFFLSLFMLQVQMGRIENAQTICNMDILVEHREEIMQVLQMVGAQMEAQQI